jgi:hypothetical protein
MKIFTSITAFGDEEVMPEADAAFRNRGAIPLAKRALKVAEVEVAQTETNSE